jgi:hypothetical protein
VKVDELDNAWLWTFVAIGFVAFFNIFLAAIVGPRLEVKDDAHTGKGKDKYSKGTRTMLNFITALAIGALVGDALIHIVPHSFETAEILAAEAKGLADPHAGHGHRFLKD